jgi:hypothetical protein
MTIRLQKILLLYSDNYSSPRVASPENVTMRCIECHSS